MFLIGRASTTQARGGRGLLLDAHEQDIGILCCLASAPRGMVWVRSALLRMRPDHLAGKLSMQQGIASHFVKGAVEVPKITATSLSPAEMSSKQATFDIRMHSPKSLYGSRMITVTVPPSLPLASL